MKPSHQPPLENQKRINDRSVTKEPDPVSALYISRAFIPQYRPFPLTKFWLKKEKKKVEVDLSGIKWGNFKALAFLCHTTRLHQRVCKNRRGAMIRMGKCWKVLINYKNISLRISSTNMIKHMITSTVAHITIPPCFCVLSACSAQFI